MPEMQDITALRERSKTREAARETQGNLLWAVISEWVDGVDRASAPSADHLSYQLQLERGGALFAAGPLAGGGEKPFGGLIILRARDREAAERLASDDPYHAGGYRRFTLFRWKMNEGHIRMVIDLGSGTAEIE